jgi:sec-independent protein translocase protein TatB
MVNTPQIELANLGMADSLILMVLALVVFGPRRLPQIGRQIGKLMYEFRKASNDFKFQMEEELRLAEDADRRKKEEEERQKAAALAAPATVEAQADAGAVEPAASETITTQESPNSGEGTYSQSAEPVSTSETIPAEPEQVVIPRVGPVIKPPSTGEPIPAARYGAVRESEPAAAEASVGAAPALSGATEHTESESTTQHG